jgi:hypothetical protein
MSSSSQNSIKNRFYRSLQKPIVTYLAKRQKDAEPDIRLTTGGHLDFMGDLDGVLAAARGVQPWKIIPSDITSLDAKLRAYEEEYDAK